MKWKVEHGVIANGILHFAVTDEQGRMICSVSPMTQVTDFDESNAKLISSAPDMAKEIAQLKADKAELQRFD